MKSYHVIGKKDGEEIITKFHLSRHEDAVTLQQRWLSEGENVILTDHRENVRFDEVEIMPTELIWRRG